MINKINKQQQVDNYTQNSGVKTGNKKANDITDNNKSLFDIMGKGGSSKTQREVSGSLNEGKKLLGQGGSLKNSITSCNSQIKECDKSSTPLYNQMNADVMSHKSNADTAINNSKSIIQQNVEKLETANTSFNETAASMAENQEAMGANLEEQEKITQEIEQNTQKLEMAQGGSANPNKSVYNLKTAAEVDQDKKDGKQNGGVDTQKQETEVIKNQMKASMTNLKSVQEEQAEISKQNDELTTTKDAATETMNNCVAQNDASFLYANNTSAAKTEEMRQKELDEKDQAANDQHFADRMGVVNTTGSAVQTTGGVCTKVSETLTAAAAGTGGCTFGASAAALESVAVPLGTLGVYAETGGAAVATTASGIQFAKTGDAKDGIAFAASAASLIGSVATASKDLSAIKDANGGSLWKADADVLDANIAATQDELVKNAETAMQKSAKATEKAEKILNKKEIVGGIDKANKKVNIDVIRNSATAKVEKKFAGKVLDEAAKQREINREMNTILRKIK